MSTTTALAFLSLLAPMTSPTEEAVRRAEQSAALAIERYQAGDFEAAARHFLRAYEGSSHPIQLRNAAKSLAQAGLLDEALRRWRDLARLEITPEERAEANAAIAILEARIDADWAHEKVRRAEERERAREASRAVEVIELPIGRYLAAGLGGIAFAGGAILYASGWLTYANAEDGMITKKEAQAARTRSGVGIGVGLAGAGVAVAALLWPDSQATSIGFVPLVGGALLAFGARL